jgi:4-hydroxy-2-oxoheptanedioate aldolase
MLRTNFLKEKLKAGKPVLGTWAIIPSVVTADIMASAGLDFMIIDSEHGPISFETAQKMVIACEARNVSPVMRLSGINEADILKALDIGVHAVQVPNVETRQDVLDIVKAAKYPPIGNRGFSPFTRAGSYSMETAKDLTMQANENTLVAINVEGKEAIENIDEILSIEALDIIFIGLFDLSKALGIPGQVDDPRVLTYLEDLTARISAAGKYAGTIATSKEKMHSFLDLGMKYIVYLVDCEMLKASYQEIRNSFDRERHETCLYN